MSRQRALRRRSAPTAHDLIREAHEAEVELQASKILKSPIMQAAKTFRKLIQGNNLQISVEPLAKLVHYNISKAAISEDYPALDPEYKQNWVISTLLNTTTRAPLRISGVVRPDIVILHNEKTEMNYKLQIITGTCVKRSYVLEAYTDCSGLFDTRNAQIVYVPMELKNLMPNCLLIYGDCAKIVGGAIGFLVESENVQIYPQGIVVHLMMNQSLVLFVILRKNYTDSDFNILPGEYVHNQIIKKIIFMYYDNGVVFKYKY